MGRRWKFPLSVAEIQKEGQHCLYSLNLRSDILLPTMAKPEVFMCLSPGDIPE